MGADVAEGKGGPIREGRTVVRTRWAAGVEGVVSVGWRKGLWWLKTEVEVACVMAVRHRTRISLASLGQQDIHP